MKTPSVVGEVSAVIAVINFLLWSAEIVPNWSKWLVVVFGIIFILDWMLGGVSDRGICKKCF